MTDLSAWVEAAKARQAEREAESLKQLEQAREQERQAAIARTKKAFDAEMSAELLELLGVEIVFDEVGTEAVGRFHLEGLEGKKHEAFILASVGYSYLRLVMPSIDDLAGKRNTITRRTIWNESSLKGMSWTDFLVLEIEKWNSAIASLRQMNLEEEQRARNWELAQQKAAELKAVEQRHRLERFEWAVEVAKVQTREIEAAIAELNLEWKYPEGREPLVVYRWSWWRGGAIDMGEDRYEYDYGFSFARELEDGWITFVAPQERRIKLSAANMPIPEEIVIEGEEGLQKVGWNYLNVEIENVEAVWATGHEDVKLIWSTALKIKHQVKRPKPWIEMALGQEPLAERFVLSIPEKTQLINAEECGLGTSEIPF